jgi:hypothetical protein
MSMADARKLADEALAMGSAKDVFAACNRFHGSRVDLD